MPSATVESITQTQHLLCIATDNALENSAESTCLPAFECQSAKCHSCLECQSAKCQTESSARVPSATHFSSARVPESGTWHSWPDSQLPPSQANALAHRPNLATFWGYHLRLGMRRNILYCRELRVVPACNLGHGSNEGNIGAAEPSATNPERKSHWASG